jgi:hypothetical protein
MKRFLAGKKFVNDIKLKESIEKWLTSQQPTSVNRAYKTLFTVMTGSSVWVMLMSKSGLRYVEFDNSE